MTDSRSELLEQRLEAWGRAETHAVSKQITEPPPAFTNAVLAQAARQRFTAIAGVVCAIVIVLAAIAWAVSSNTPSPAAPPAPDVPAELGILDSDRTLPLIGGAAPRRHLR